MDEFLIMHGATLSSTVTKDTTLVVYGPDKGAKFAQAQAKGIKVQSEEEFRKWLADNGSNTTSKRKAEADAEVPPAKAARTGSAPSGSGLAGQVVCLTGTMSKPRAKMVDFLEGRGAQVVNTVTAKCTMLVCGAQAEGTAKYQQAVAKGIRLVKESDLEEESLPAPAASSLSDPKVEKEVEPSEASSPAKSSAAKSGTQKLIKKGKGVVDIHSGMADTTHIYEEGSEVYQVMLNQTNIGQNNNKFYVIQLLEADAGGKWWVWTRWARVGQVGQSKLEPAPTLDRAKALFGAKFSEKTRNAWNNRHNFEKVPGKYMLMDMDYGEEAEEESPAAPASPTKVPESKLDARVQSIISMITDTKMMTAAMAELEVDVKKMPLGKISKQQVKKGYEVLTRLAEAIKKNEGGTKLSSLSSEFYTIIPHDFGMRVPPVINTEALIHRKIELLDILAELEIASKLLGSSGQSAEHPADAAYNRLKCQMRPLDKESATWNLIRQYLQNTHGKTHTAYTLEVVDILEVAREGEEERYQASIGNRMLLWHGSRLPNFMGILSQGLRIAPPEAPATGYMFGKGVYFADMVTKSANYCHANKKDSVALMLLADVALGTPYPLKGAKYMDKAPAGFQSTFGQGAMMPDPAASGHLDGMTVPLGPTVNPPDHHGSSLLYNEFIVYDVCQVKLRYLLKVKFNFK
eukprot:GGOE01036669.1.p1 GENE.GGOE01036669.1~~GGOE01036669.1.p1  ORF type:complete len:715 (+),score=259.95 GGOE01036669.1:85-2145(+)